MRWTSASAWSGFARRGLYGRNSFRGDALDYRDRYFTETGDGHQLSAQVMEQVRFQSGNLFDAGLLAHAPAYDFVFCRNLLIYFDQATQERAVQVLRRHRARMACCSWARPKPACSRRAGCRRWRCRIASPSWRGAPDAAPPLPPVQARGLAGAAGIARPRAAPARAAPTHAPSGPPCGAAAAPVVAVAAKSESEAEISLRQIEALADQGRVKDAIARCGAHLERYGASADGFYLQGLLQDAAGDARQAQAAYRKVLYLQPNHREALLHLAALVASEGDHESAQAAGARGAQEARRD